MQMSKKTVPFLLMLAMLMSFGAGLHAQETHTFTLEQAIEYGLENNLTIENARFDEYIANSRVKEVLASGYPQLSGTVEPQAFLQLPKTILPGDFSPEQELVLVQRADGGVQPIPVTKINPETGMPIPGDPIEAVFGYPIQFTAGANLNQLLFDGTFFLGVKAAKSYTGLAHKQLNRTREETAYAISQAYYQALITAERSKIVDANVGRVEQLFRETEGLFQEGFVEKLDVDRLRINLNNLYLEQSKVTRLEALTLNLLKYQMGMPLEDEVILEVELDTLIENREPTQLTANELNLNQRIDYQLLESQRELEEYDLRRIKAGYLPSVYLFGSYQYQYQGEPNDLTDNQFDLTGLWFPLSLVGVTVNVPIFDGLRKHQQAQQSRLELEKIDNQFQLLEQGARLEYEQASTELENAYATLLSTERTRDLAQQVYETTRLKYREGVGSSLEVNEAESQLKEAEANYLSSMLEYLLTQTELAKARGDFSRYHE